MSKMRDVYDQPGNSSYKLQRTLKSASITFALVVLTLICLIPIYLIIMNATHSNQEIISNPISLLPGGSVMDNLDHARKSFGFKAELGFRNSFVIAGSATVLTMFFSCLTAYGICVYDFKLKDSAFTFIVAVMMVPAQVIGVGFISFMLNFFGMNLLGTYWPLIIPAVAAPAVVFFMCQNMKATFPFDIIEAARIDGCGEFRTFLTIGLPMLKPAIAVQAIFAFVASWNNYYMPSMILAGKDDKLKTMPLMIQALTTIDKDPDRGANAAAIAISIFPMIVAYVILSRFIIEGIALGGVKE